ncbi:EF-hand domain-containing protein [Phyllobacterium myrsinacearum]|uniref:Histidine kinase n=1 Tax=Phyllobacterium myrsinacearum TaxID=28101 RepID=A0A2S9JQV2_9HYPH|nr:EF-hand domain-containing protein [Phyllobacterium myrsinacearum]PRD55565.1 histidine kinase [Phyllobacterium myrsinacearum]PWV91920.1 EF hand domain-containing protein [Phyllobacterium myrsinacearum]RZV05987.1 EF hand domain-containing protein [Phyllobacterium myrsinacearum]
MKTILAAVVVLTAFTTFPALAQEKPADKEKVDKTFDRIDTNKDGSIDRAELSVYLLAVVDKQRSDFESGFLEMDVNKDGKIDKEEAKANAVLLSYFDPLDSDKDGFLSKAELDAAMDAAAKIQN